MTRSLLTRRTFLHASGAIASGGVAVAAAADATPHAAAESDIVQSEDGVVCHPEVGGSDLMKGFPPPADWRVTIDNYGSSTEMMRWAMLHPATVFHTREVDRGPVPVRALPRHMVDPAKVDSVRVNWGKGGEVTVAEWLRGSGTDAFVALHDGHIVAEQYFGEMTPQTQHRVFSIAKSFTAAAGSTMLANQAVDERELASHYVPELEQTAYQGATVRQLLDMQVSIGLSAHSGTCQRPVDD